MDNILILDNVLSLDECSQIIKNNKLMAVNKDTTKEWNYEYYDMPMDILLHRIATDTMAAYMDKNPAIKMTADPWELNQFRFKHFPPKQSFNGWHSEHTFDYPYRIACILVYLTDHNCGTEFYNGEVIKSVAGRVVMFPTFWTHTHRGQVCPENKSRYILSSYIHLRRINGH